MYSKLDNKAGVNKNGVGLGLTISNALAILLSGDPESKGLDVESEYNLGSKFYFEIHKSLQEKSPLQARKNELNLEGSVFSNGIIHDADNDATGTFLVPRTITIEEQKVPDEDPDFSSGGNEHDEFPTLCNLQSKMNSYLALKRSVFSSVIKNFCDNGQDSPENEEVQKIKNPSISQKLESADHININFNTHILVVDDNPFNLLVAKNLFNDSCYKIKTAMSGEEAIQILTKCSPEELKFKAIFMDCQMPIMDGFETTKTLKAMMRDNEIPDIPIFAWTANNSEEDVQRCFEAGMTGHLPKPASKPDVLKVISNM